LSGLWWLCRRRHDSVKPRLIDVEKNNAEDDIVLNRIPQVVPVR